MKKKLIIFFVIILPFYLTAVVFGMSAVLVLIKHHNINLRMVLNCIEINQDNVVLYGSLIALGIYIVFASWKLIPSKGKQYTKDSKSGTYGSANWLSEKQIKKKYPKIDLFNPKNEYGIVVRSEKDKKDSVKVNVRKDSHTIIIAGTRAGKTQGFVKPTLQVMARSTVKPSLCISDPKGELFNNDSAVFQEHGYKVIKIDLREPQYSYSWNVLSEAFNNWEKYCQLESKEQETGEMLSSYLFKQKTIDSINDICETLFYSTNSKDDFWNSGARDITKGILLGILYEMKDNNCLDQNKFNLAEIIPIINDVKNLKEYFISLNSTHPARMAAGSIDASGDALNDIASTLKNKIGKFSDLIIRNLIVKNDVNFSEIVSEPTVIFLVSPDDRKDKDIFVSLFVTQLYKILAEKADIAKGKLKRPFYFILDEFPTLTIPDMERKIAVSGGRNIWFTLVIQSKTQLETTYGKHAKTIMDNCHMHIIIQLQDAESAESYSKLIGKKTVISYSHSDKSKSSQEKGINLIKPDELISMPMGEGIIMYVKEQPLKTYFVPMWTVDKYIEGSVPDKLNIPMSDKEFTKNYFFDLGSMVHSEFELESSENDLNEIPETLSIAELQAKKLEVLAEYDDLMESEKLHSTKELKDEISIIQKRIKDINTQIKKAILLRND